MADGGMSIAQKLESLCLDIITNADQRTGITATQIHGGISIGRSMFTPHAIRVSCVALAERGLIAAHQTRKKGVVRFTLPDAQRPPDIREAPAAILYRDQHVEIVETPEMSLKLRDMFYRVRPLNYAHGNIITLEKGRAPSRPPTQIATRVTGAW